jgi:hypothetical protein
MNGTAELVIENGIIKEKEKPLNSNMESSCAMIDEEQLNNGIAELVKENGKESIRINLSGSVIKQEEQKKQIKVTLTQHSTKRIRERAGIQRGYEQRFATKAFNSGNRARSFHYKGVKWCQEIEYNGFNFVFKHTLCLTMWRKG